MCIVKEKSFTKEEVQKAANDAKAIVELAERNLKEEGAQFVLGAGAEYSLADVFMTTYLTRA